MCIYVLYGLTDPLNYELWEWGPCFPHSCLYLFLVHSKCLVNILDMQNSKGEQVLWLFNDLSWSKWQVFGLSWMGSLPLAHHTEGGRGGRSQGVKMGGSEGNWPGSNQITAEPQSGHPYVDNWDSWVPNILSGLFFMQTLLGTWYTWFHLIFKTAL